MQEDTQTVLSKLFRNRRDFFPAERESFWEKEKLSGIFEVEI